MAGVNFLGINDIIEIAYRLQVKISTVHEGPRRGEGLLGAGRGAIILCHDKISKFAATTKFSETVTTTTFSKIAATTTFLKRLPQQRNIGCHNASTAD